MPSTMAMGVYALVCREADKLYVGSARDFRKRQWQHRTDLRRKKHPNTGLQALFDRHGMKGLHFVVLEPITHSGNLETREQAWLDSMFAAVPASVLNVFKDARGARGHRWKMTPEQAVRSAQSKSGTKRTAETRKRMSEAQTGRVVSDEAKARMSAAATGRKHTAETKAKMAATRTGKKLSPEHVEAARQGLLAFNARKRAGTPEN